MNVDALIWEGGIINKIDLSVLIDKYNLFFRFFFSIRQVNLAPVNGSRSYSGDVRKITLIPGDGIGPEISAAVQQIFKAANVPLEWETVDVTPVRVSLHYLKTFKTENAFSNIFFY